VPDDLKPVTLSAIDTSTQEWVPYLAAEKDGHLDDLTSNHSPKFLPPDAALPADRHRGPGRPALAWLAP
jgi:hypothetical protein